MINRHDSDGPVGSGDFNILQGVTAGSWSALERSMEYEEDPKDVVDAWITLFAEHVRDLCDKYGLSIDEVMWRQKEFQEQIELDLELHRQFRGLGWAKTAEYIKHELKEVQHDGQVIGYRMELTFPSVDGSGPAAVRDIFFPVDEPVSDVRDALEGFAEMLIYCRDYGHPEENDDDIVDHTEYEKKQLVEHGLKLAIDDLVILIDKGVMDFAHGTEILRILQDKLHLDYEPVADVVPFKNRGTRHDVTNITTRTTHENVLERVKTLIGRGQNLIEAEQFAKRSISSLRQSISYGQAAIIFNEIQKKLHAALAAPSPSSVVAKENVPEGSQHAHRVLCESQESREADVYLWISQAMKRLLSAKSDKVRA